MIENRMVGARGWEGENGELVSTVDGISVLEDENVWKWLVVIVAKQCEYSKCYAIVHFNMTNFLFPEFHLNKKIIFIF